MSMLAAEQWGLVTTAQCARLGASGKLLARLHAGRVIRRTRHGVYALADAPASTLEAVRAEWLATGPQQAAAERVVQPDPIIVCDETAADIWGFGDFSLWRIHFASPRRRQTAQPMVQFVTRRIPLSDWQLVDGLPVTTPRRTLEDLVASGRWNQDQLATATRDAIAGGHLPLSDAGRSPGPTGLI